MTETARALPTLSSMAEAQVSTEYATFQRRYYDERIHSLEDARALVGCYQDGLRVMPSILQFVMDEYRQRRFAQPIHAMRLLDFGCGVGRIMEAARGFGFRHVDGVDISSAMLEYARSNPALTGARFFLGSGADCGDAPHGQYDLITSFFCLQHVCHQGNRMGIFRAMADCLSHDGMVALEFQYYPSIDAAGVPGDHAPWGEHRVSSVTNSEADVWITPDRLGRVLQDLSSCFHDVSFQVVDLFRPEEYDPTRSLATVNYRVPFSHLYVFGTKRRGFAASVYQETAAA
ncbi:MAG: class I SAM-dependent methyltransferase [Acidobacteria bacterium]|nr:class I SAM-dependent methyltransferase [Acidobacteriota bacterium]